MNKPSPSTANETHKVSIKLPPFWTKKPEVWFYQVEAQFEITGITVESTKFNYLVAQLELKYVENIWDLVSDRNITDKYTAAKERLLSIFKESENKRIRRLVTGIELGDTKPSQLLQKMRSLATDDISDKVLKTLWLDKLADNVKNILLVSDENLEKLAITADRIAEMSTGTECYTTSRNVPPWEEVLQRMSAMEHQIEKLIIDRQSRSLSRNFGRNKDGNRSRYGDRSKSRKRRSFNPKGKYCYYHFNFGDKCMPEKCTPPSAWNHYNQGKANQQ
ncbi:hypothetical protein WN55_08981 [Dufourea novaeangliae]|uniref:DUF7041 domain-containing protein n=1 Tax=Dufourea novaeangliae TaxID=178035 RepID=A0A154PT26_DUFNO|nr:hypothetical protein WN55_08981 [Dufourea novaeangliae]